MRLPDQGDRDLVGKSANLSDDQIKELAKLPCGVAAVYQNEWIQPILCKVEKTDVSESSFVYHYNLSKTVDHSMEDRIKIADMLSRGLTLGKEVSGEYVVDLLKALRIPALSVTPPIKKDIRYD